MTLEKLIADYNTNFDSKDINMIENEVADKGIVKFLSQQLIYLDCSRIKNGMRLMQTIGYPYKREISKYIYALENWSSTVTCPDDYDKNPDDYWIDKLLERHEANISFEEVNPPVWYGGKKAKDKWLKDNTATKLPRRRKAKEQTIPGMGKELSSAEKLKKLTANFGPLTFKIKPVNKNG